MGHAENALVRVSDELDEAKAALERAGFEHTDQGWVPVRDTAKRPEILVTNAELVDILQDHPHGLASLDGSVVVTVRLYTPEELVTAQRLADEKLSAQSGTPMVGPMPYAQAVELTRPLPPFPRRVF